MLGRMKKFWSDESGATAIEYAMIAGIVGLGIISGLTKIPTALDRVWGNVNSNL